MRLSRISAGATTTLVGPRFRAKMASRQAYVPGVYASRSLFLTTEPECSLSGIGNGHIVVQTAHAQPQSDQQPRMGVDMEQVSKVKGVVDEFFGIAPAQPNSEDSLPVEFTSKIRQRVGTNSEPPLALP